MTRRNPYARPDARTRSAKASGYPARSVHKLREIDRRHRLLREGQRVLDLGAAPGSWAMYAAERVGDRGAVVAVDQNDLAEGMPGVVEVVKADVLADEFVESADLAAGGRFDVVLSDMAPKTSGTKLRDQVLSFELFMAALSIAERVGAPGSSFVGKIFMSEDFPDAKRGVQDHYRKVKAIKPSGTRPNSSEIYLVGMGRRGGD